MSVDATDSIPALGSTTNVLSASSHSSHPLGTPGNRVEIVRSFAPWLLKIVSHSVLHEGHAASRFVHGV